MLLELIGYRMPRFRERLEVPKVWNRAVISGGFSRPRLALGYVDLVISNIFLRQDNGLAPT